MQAAQIIARRLQRQGRVSLGNDAEAYNELFRRLQPVSTVHNTYPGSPPSLEPRTPFDDKELTARMRPTRQIVKGRFLGDGIGYVLAGDLQLYANCFRKPLPRPNETQRLVLEAVQNCGALTPRQLKEETGLLNKQIMPALHRLQTAFIVFEDQADTDWERPWYLFSEEWPEVAIDERLRAETTQEVLIRFMAAHLFATLENLRDWSRLPLKALRPAMDALVTRNVVKPTTIEGLGEGWLVCEREPISAPPRPSVIMLHKADPLVRAHASELKRAFGHLETLRYLLIDGTFQGAVCGRWGIKAHDVDDIHLLLPDAECATRKQEILEVVSRTYRAPEVRILKYCGATIPDTQ